MKKVDLNQLIEEMLIENQEILSIEHNGKLLGYFYRAFSEQTENFMTPQEALNGLRQLRSSFIQTDLVEIMRETRQELEERRLF